MILIRRQGKSGLTMFLIGCFDKEWQWTADYKKATDYGNLSLQTIKTYVATVQCSYPAQTVEAILC